LARDYIQERYEYVNIQDTLLDATAYHILAINGESMSLEDKEWSSLG